MPDESAEPDQIPAADLEEWYRRHNGRDANGRLAGIGIQARDRLIRRLIDEVQRLRASRERPSFAPSEVRSPEGPVK